MVNVRAALRTVAQIEAVRQLRNLQRKAFSGKYLLATNIGLSWSLSTLGDLLEQQYERYEKRLVGKRQDWDLIRTRNMGIAGCSIGFICHYWYLYLDKRLPGRTINIVMKKIVLDQLICSPVYISAFFITLGILERESKQQIWNDLKTKAYHLYIAEWVVWPFAQFANFYWLPSRYRVFYDNLISLGYDIYTSRIKHHDKDDDNDDKSIAQY